MLDTTTLTITQARKLLETKEITSVELIIAHLQKIKEVDKELNAFITVCEESVLEEARKADVDMSSGKSTTLTGIPLAFKDAFNTKDIRTTAGSKVLDDYIAPYDATSVSRLKNEGALVLGKTNMDAWAHGSSGENSDYGVTKNPYDHARVAGGSSSGSAAAVASGMALAATGTDTGGSIRLPAAFTGTVGLKPTYGRVSRYGIVAMGSSFDSIGHITKTVEDSALLLKITAGLDTYDATTSSLPVPNYMDYLNKSINGMKIGIIKEFLTDGIDAGILKNWDESIARMKSLGAEIVEISLPHTHVAMACYYVLVPAEVSSNLGRYDGIRYGNDRSFFADEAKRRIMTGTFTLSSGYYDAYYKKAALVRELIKKDFNDAFEKVDCLMAPVSPTTAFNIGEKTQNPIAMYLSDIFTCPMNLAGNPAISVPSGMVDDLPVGIQFVSPHFTEERLFQVGNAFEKSV